MSWLRSPWVWAPAGAAAAAGAGVWLARRRHIADCGQVGPTGGTVAGVRYLERIRGKADPDAALPLVVLFHSRGATPEGHAAMLGGIGPARLILPQGPYPTGSGFGWWRKGIKDAAKDVDAAAPEWERTASQVIAFVDAIVQCRPTLGRPILTGSSQGGELTLLLSSTEPRAFSGGVAVSGYLLPPFWTPRMAPTAMINGTGDTVVPFSWAKDYAQAMIGQGAPLSFTPMPSTGHAVTGDMAKAWIGTVSALVEQAWSGAVAA